MGRVRRMRMLGAAVTVAVVAVSCSGGDGGHANHDASDDVSDRCDADLNTAAFNESTELVHHHAHDHMNVGDAGFTLEQWADAFASPALGMTPAQVLDGLAGNEIYRRHILGGVLTHSLGPDPWVAMTDPAACDRLADELDEARAAAARYPTVADAVAAGYMQGDTYYAGLGVHFQDYASIGEFDAGHPVQLLYDGATPDSTLVGLSYVMMLPGEVPPEGFTGVNDRWHRHKSFCLDSANGSLNLAADVLSPEECAALGGSPVSNPELWMLHAWVVPGCESDWGIFSAANPRLPYIPDDARLVSGCTANSVVSLASSR